MIEGSEAQQEIIIFINELKRQLKKLDDKITTLVKKLTNLEFSNFE